MTGKYKPTEKEIIEEQEKYTPSINADVAEANLVEAHKQEELDVFNFSVALEHIKAGRKVTRIGWNNTSIKVRLQSPDENSMNTEPYLIMEKLEGENKRVFPLDLSCESIFAEDWFVVI